MRFYYHYHWLQRELGFHSSGVKGEKKKKKPGCGVQINGRAKIFREGETEEAEVSEKPCFIDTSVVRASLSKIES